VGQRRRTDGVHVTTWLSTGRSANRNLPTRKRPARQYRLLPLICVLVVSGCATNYASFYAYRAISENCNCEEYWVADKQNKIGYLFQAHYRMEDGIVTSIDVKFVNNTKETLTLDHGAVKVSSRNFAYQYNDKFIPLPLLTIRPGGSDEVHLSGREVSAKDDWNKIAGERLTVTIRGVRLGDRELPEQAARFVPENPKIENRKSSQ